MLERPHDLHWLETQVSASDVKVIVFWNPCATKITGQEELLYNNPKWEDRLFPNAVAMLNLFKTRVILATLFNFNDTNKFTNATEYKIPEKAKQFLCDVLGTNSKGSDVRFCETCNRCIEFYESNVDYTETLLHRINHNVSLY